MKQNPEKILSALCICLILSNLTLTDIFTKNPKKAKRMLANIDSDTSSDTHSDTNSDTNNDNNSSDDDHNSNKSKSTKTKDLVAEIGSANAGVAGVLTHISLTNEVAKLPNNQAQKPQIPLSDDEDMGSDYIDFDKYTDENGDPLSIDQLIQNDIKQSEDIDQSTAVVEDPATVLNLQPAGVQNIDNSMSGIDEMQIGLDAPVEIGNDLTGVADDMADVAEVLSIPI